MMVCSLLLFFFLCLFCSPTWALASSILRLQASLSSASLLQFLYFNILLASLSAAPSSSGSSNWSSTFCLSFQCFLEHTFVLHPSRMTHPLDHLYMIFPVSSSSLYKLQISWFYLFRQWCIVVLQVSTSFPKVEGAHTMQIRKAVNSIRLDKAATL